MTGEEITASLGLPPWVAPFYYDATYARPSRSWLFGKFAPWFVFNRKSLGVGTWTRKNDCDNAARAFCVGAQDAHAETSHTAEGIAVGEFCYISSRGPHAANIALVETGRCFIEPQDGSEIFPTPAEILTCFRVSF